MLWDLQAKEATLINWVLSEIQRKETRYDWGWRGRDQRMLQGVCEKKSMKD